MRNRGFSRKVIEAIWDYVRKYGYVCYYTGMILEMEDFTSPWYCTFNHWSPGDPRKIVLTFALLNAMKGDRTEDELWYYVLQLDNHRKKHTTFRKRNPIHWYRLLNNGCHGCGRLIALEKHKYCSTCSKIAHRMKANNFDRKAIESVWAYVRKYGFVCHYTGRALDMDDPHSPWYCVFDHWIPRDSRKLVLTSRLINEMKVDMTEKEFWYVIGQLADYRRNGTKVKRIKLAYWSRNYV